MFTSDKTLDALGAVGSINAGRGRGEGIEEDNGGEGSVISLDNDVRGKDEEVGGRDGSKGGKSGNKGDTSRFGGGDDEDDNTDDDEEKEDEEEEEDDEDNDTVKGKNTLATSAIPTFT